MYSKISHKFIIDYILQILTDWLAYKAEFFDAVASRNMSDLIYIALNVSANWRF